jgi:hypothetical protein
VNDAVSSKYVDTIQEDDGTWLEPYFQLVEGIEYIDMTKLQEQAVADREAGCATGMCPHVSPATLRRAAEAGTVERMELSLVKEERNYQNEQDSEPKRSKVYLYWDESAHLKQRPWNERATFFYYYYYYYNYYYHRPCQWHFDWRWWWFSW